MLTKSITDIYDPSLYTDFVDVFVPTFFKHTITQRFPDATERIIKSPQFHRDIIDDLKKLPFRLLVLAPRGTAKSTLVTFLWTLYSSLYGLSSFKIIVSDSHTKAANFVSRIKREIEQNTLLKKVYKIEIMEPWTRDEIVFNVNWLPEDRRRIRIVARGLGQSLRGYVDDVRPDEIILDDVESDLNCDTHKKRDDNENWFWGQVIPALDPVVGRLNIVGTIVHSDSLLAKLYNNPPEGWVINRIELLNKDGTSVWPERFSVERIQQLKDEYIRQGRLAKFYMEYFNDPSHSEVRPLDDKRIREYDPYNLQENLQTIISVDFGASLNIMSDPDYSVVVAVSFDNYGNSLIRKYIRERMPINETIDYIYDLYNEFKAGLLALETYGMQKSFLYLIEQAGKERGVYLNIEEISQKIQKERKIITMLQPKINAGKFFILPTMIELRDEISAFPRGKHDDVIDAIANVYLAMSKKGMVIGKHPINTEPMSGSVVHSGPIYMP